jgi:hypothetical protein
MIETIFKAVQFLIGGIAGYFLLLFINYVLKKIDRDYDKPLNIILRTVALIFGGMYLILCF